uniref:Hypothetical secreted peptide n=1 Tax=Glossina morsitans morsitans TaxID=37546 RepID=D3TSI0_GLOMM
MLLFKLFVSSSVQILLVYVITGFHLHTYICDHLHFSCISLVSTSAYIYIVVVGSSSLFF